MDKLENIAFSIEGDSSAIKGAFTPGHFLIGYLSDPEKTRCKCALKRIRDGYKFDRSNHFRRWSGPYSR